MSIRRLNGRQIDFIRTLREAGAVRRDTPFTIDQNAPIQPDELEQLVETEVISRVAPYQYYLHADSRQAKLIAAMESTRDDSVSGGPPRAPSTRARMIKATIFWIIVMLIPILLLRLLGTR